METCQSPRKVMTLAWRIGKRCLPAYASRFSRRDFTLPQLFACLVLRQFYNLSYRKTEALLRDCPSWRRAIGMKRTPDHNTLCDAFDVIVKRKELGRMLDLLADAFEKAGLLKLDDKPLAIDASCYESRHVSRHFERRQREKDRELLADLHRSRTIRKLPKLAIAVAASCHLVLAASAMTGAGPDHAHFEKVLFDAWRRAPVRTVVADAGYDSENAHCLARDDMALVSIIPPLSGRPSRHPPPTHYRRMMHEGFKDGSLKEEYGQRWQSETSTSMMKRNHGSALRARTPQRRERELLLKVVTHNIAL